MRTTVCGLALLAAVLLGIVGCTSSTPDNKVADISKNIRIGDRLDGRRALHFDDPDGNHVELVSNNPARSGHRVADEWGYTKDI